ncbi:hypothetical protein C8R47DRAFT_1216728 [Mycena vitilis]|nr:hypothetical protein C8R47DRAFT_1216728 [Mycena vitilis]
MDSCPNEIIGEIVQFLGKPDLLSLRLAGRRLKDVATPSAFAQLTVYDDMVSAHRFDNLMRECDAETILHAVKVFVFDGSSPDHFDIGAIPTPLLFENSFSVLFRFCNLQTLKLEFFPEGHSDSARDYLSYYVEIQLAVFSGLSNSPLPELRTLQIESMAMYYSPMLDEIGPFLALFQSLTALTISVTSVAQTRNHPAATEVLPFNPNFTYLLNAAHNITSLELGASVLSGPTSPFAFDILVFPALASLALHAIVLPGLPDGEEPPPALFDGQRLTAELFIANHKATLRHLTLHNCAVPILDGAWHRVLRRFQFELELIEFAWSVHPPWPAAREHFFYARPTGHFHTYQLVEDEFPFDGNSEEDREDLAALDALQTAVMFRRNSITPTPRKMFLQNTFS